MDAKKSKFILLAGYCIPYVFLCLYGDAVWGTGMVYGIAAVAVAILCVAACKTQNIKMVVLGNIISFAVSELCVMLFALETLNYYFKPFNVHMLVGICSVIAILIQAYLISRLTDDRKRSKDILNNRQEKNAARKFFGK